MKLEYALILALISCAVIMGAKSLGRSIGDGMTSLSEEMSVVDARDTEDSKKARSIEPGSVEN